MRYLIEGKTPLRNVMWKIRAKTEFEAEEWCRKNGIVLFVDMPSGIKYVLQHQFEAVFFERYFRYLKRKYRAGWEKVFKNFSFDYLVILN